MNKEMLTPQVQNYIIANLDADVNKIALGKPLFKKITSAEVAGQILAKKKSGHKLPTWFNHSFIYYPTLLSIEQTSSEITAAYKADLAIGKSLIDLTAGFGVDSYFFSRKIETIYSCEINSELAEISAHNAKILKATNITSVAVDGLEFLRNTNQKFDTIYIDPARRSHSNKVFRLKDCTPDVTSNLSLFIEKGKRIIIKTAPLLDISAGLNELTNVSEIHIVSIKNECKELLWMIDQNYSGTPKIICATLNNNLKTFSFSLTELQSKAKIAKDVAFNYLYEPDVALLKSGAFNLIGEKFNLQKLHLQSHLYVSNEIDTSFLGRIFEIKALLSINMLKKEKELIGNVIVRNFPEKAENLVKKYNIRSSHDEFIVFTQTDKGYIAIQARIIQHY
jgi:16S rRNA G966 N2-methylase RsmD